MHPMNKNSKKCRPSLRLFYRKFSDTNNFNLTDRSQQHKRFVIIIARFWVIFEEILPSLVYFSRLFRPFLYAHRLVNAGQWYQVSVHFRGMRSCSRRQSVHVGSFYLLLCGAGSMTAAVGLWPFIQVRFGTVSAIVVSASVLLWLLLWWWCSSFFSSLRWWYEHEVGLQDKCRPYNRSQLVSVWSYLLVLSLTQLFVCVKTVVDHTKRESGDKRSNPPQRS